MPRARLVSVLAGLAVVVGAQLAPLDGRFSTHMVQHLLIGDLGPLLLALGRPWRIRPIASLPLWVAVLAAWHVTPLYDAALHHETLHALQHVCFLVAGVAVWSTLLGRTLRTVAKIPFVLVIWVLSLALSQIFLWSGHSYYAGYTLADQRAGGGVMLVEGSVVMLGVIVWLLMRVFAETELRQRALDGR